MRLVAKGFLETYEIDYLETLNIWDGLLRDIRSGCKDENNSGNVISSCNLCFLITWKLKEEIIEVSCYEVAASFICKLK